MVEHRQHPTSSVIVPEPVLRQREGCCSVPSNASSAAKNTRRVSIIILIIHVITLYAWPLQYVGNIIGIVMGSIVLYSFTKRTYTTAGVLYILGFISDAGAAGVLIFLVTIDDDDMGPTPTDIAVLFVTPPVLGALAFLVGSVFAFKAVGNWEQSGALRGSLL